MGLLTNDWGFSVDKSELNPNDPLVNTASEYMYQMATITYHTLHAATTVMLDKDVMVGDKVYTAGTYDFQNTASIGPASTGRTRSRVPPADRSGPRQHSPSSVSSASAASTASALQLGLGIAAILGGIGLMFLITGLGLVWVARATTETVKAPALRPATSIA